MNDIHAMPGYLVRRFQQIAVAIFLEEVAGVGVELTPVQFAALSVVASHPGVDQATLAGLIAYDRSTIGGVVDRLVQRGYIARHVAGRDRRARELRLTPAGARVLERVGPAVARAQESILSGLDADERRLLMALLTKATDAVNERSRAPLRATPSRETD